MFVPRTALRSLAAIALIATIAFAQAPVTPAKPATPATPTTLATPASPATPATPAAPASPVSGMRNKLSAGDLLSAESILDVHRAKNGEDGPYLIGLSWLARGALLVGELDKAQAYVNDVRARCSKRLAAGDTLETKSDLESALGAVIEVQAQLLQRSKGSEHAARFVRDELSHIPAPVALRSRLNKRINLLTLAGTAAPELVVDDFLGTAPPSLEQLRGKPVLLFLWAEWCGDCRSQVAALSAIRTRYAREGLQVIALTRFYDEDRAREKARVDSVWTAGYGDVGPIPRVFSTASMERYGGSSTPTFVFIDRRGVVRGYTPTRLTEAAFDEWMRPLL